MSRGFNNPIAGGDFLVRPQLQSPNFVTGVSGWSINRDGSAEFQNLLARATIILGNVSGAHILLDSTTGVIQVFNSSGTLVGIIDSTGQIKVQDPTTGAFVSLLVPPGDLPQIQVRTVDFGGHTFAPAVVTSDTATVPDRARLLIKSPSMDGQEVAGIVIEGAHVDSGAVFINTFDGLGATTGNARFQVNGNNVPWGLLSLGVDTVSTAVLSNVAGTYTAVVGNAADIPVHANRHYLITYWNEGLGVLLVSGSGFAVGDTWAGKFQRSQNGGATWVDISNELEIYRAQVAQANRSPIHGQSVIYSPSVDANIRWQWLAAKTTGAGTVTSTIAPEHHISVIDIGGA